MLPNPYTPGAGFMPAYLAGREDLIQEAERALYGIQKNYPQQSMIFYGLRGVGKTVLLNCVEDAAENMGILYAHIEAGEKEMFSKYLIAHLTRFAQTISAKEHAKDIAKKCMDVLRSFKITYNLEDQSFSLDAGSGAEYSSGIYDDDLTTIFVNLGRAAKKSGDAICFFVDEIQYLKPEEIKGIVVAIHRCNQLRLPILLVGAGLPRVLKLMGETCSYAERLFRFHEVDALTPEQAEAAIRNPAADFNVVYTDEAVTAIIAETGGYPYFIQEFCNVIWNYSNKEKPICVDDVESAKMEFFHNLDKSFFPVRYNKCTPRERDFMIAMVRCGTLPCTIANVAKAMKRQVNSISTYRAQLINKGMIYPTGHAEIDFTVPQFDNHIRRINPNLEFSE